jgi:dipeptidyl-peptidase 4
MNRKSIVISVLFTMLVLGAAAVSIYPVPNIEKVDPSKLSLEDLFKVKAFSGKRARSLSFSNNDRFLAFRWNPYGEYGNDLYIYNLDTKKLKRVTSIDRMKQYDPPEDYERFIKKMEQKKKEDKRKQELYFAQRDYLMGKDVDLEKFEKEELEQLKKELEEEKKKKEKKDITKDTTKDEQKKDQKQVKKEKENKEKKELELWELRDKLKEKKKKDKIKNSDLYPGVSRYKWSKKNTELIFQYRGDLYRYFPLKDTIQRLTMSDGSEYLIDYTTDGLGYYYSSKGNVYRVKFGDSLILQINPKLKDKLEDDDEDSLKVVETSISPNGKWVMMVAEKRKGKPGNRTINIMDYKNRFAEPVKVKRTVLDDRVNKPTQRYYLRRINTGNYGKEPEHVFEMKGGDNFYEMGPIAWSKDGSKYAFMTWEREKGDLKIWTGETEEGKKAKLLYETRQNLGFEFFEFSGLTFTPDGTGLVTILNNKDGFKHPNLFNLKTGKKRALSDGSFEALPIIDFSKDGKSLYLLCDKLDPAVHTIYKLSLKTGKMTQIGKSGGMHRSTELSHNGKWLATIYGNWDKRPELYLMNTAGGKEKVLTNSHKKDWEKYYLIKPELFKLKNRHGNTLSAMIFKPKGWKPEDKRPAIVYMYGGPLGTGHTVEADLYSQTSFLFPMAMAAKHGYVCINIDIRGMSGYGQEFSDANFQQVGRPQVEDLEDLLKHIKKGFGVDNKRVGLYGWSFGGFQTIMTMLSSPETFATGIAVASVTEWENYNQWYVGAFVTKRVAGKPTARKYSLLPLAKNLKHPMLLIHGMQDQNVLFQDTLNIYSELLKAGKETLVELFVDPEGGHGLRGIVPGKSVYKKFESWFLRHLGKQ